MGKILLPEHVRREIEKADSYSPGTRIKSRFTRRKGTVLKWPEGRPHPEGHGEEYGAIWVHWDDGVETHAWRHQVSRA